MEDMNKIDDRQVRLKEYSYFKKERICKRYYIKRIEMKMGLQEESNVDRLGMGE